MMHEGVAQQARVGSGEEGGEIKFLEVFKARSTLPQTNMETHIAPS